MDTSQTSAWASLIAQVGFPIFVAVWLLVRSDKIIADLTEAIRDLKSCVESLKK
jgi:hypothetical protein